MRPVIPGGLERGLPQPATGCFRGLFHWHQPFRKAPESERQPFRYEPGRKILTGIGAGSYPALVVVDGMNLALEL